VADKGGASRVTAVAVVTATLVWLPIAFGRTSLVALIAGIILLDFAAQSLHITNQSEIYRLRAEAGSRLNSAYMTARFLGGAAGSGLSTVAYVQSGWTGVSVLGALFGLVITAIWGTRRMLGRD
jgi:predicted MFS family arabinose efflux permease